MTSRATAVRCAQAHQTSAFALSAIPAAEAAALELHLAECSECHDRLAALRSVIGSFASWPGELLQPPQRLRERLAMCIAAERSAAPPALTERAWTEPEWEQVAPGITCKLLATDHERHRVSMLVTLAPGASYPPHTHAGREELYLLDGELWIEERKLYPGDYNRAECGTADERVWSETGCTCVLITSTRDVLAAEAP